MEEGNTLTQEKPNEISAEVNFADKFSLSEWIFKCFFGGGFLIGGEALLMEGNLWPITGVLGAIGGLIIGIISGVILKLLNVSHRSSQICFVILCIIPMLWMYLAVKRYVPSI